MAKNTRLNSLTVEAIRAVAYKEAADAGADVITVEWVARRLTKSKKWVRENWVRSYGQVLEGDIWIPGGIDEGIRKRQSTDVHRSERVKKLMQTVLVKPLMELTEFNRPMPFIETNPDGTFQINDLARRALLANERPVCIVAIVGKYRTGKSFLMNRLYGRNSGFPLGGTIESETKGIWIWQRQHPQDPSKTLVLMDTEGLFDVKKGDSTHDMKLFTLAVLLSSCFVYNIQSTIDEALIQQLHLVSQLTEHIKTKNTRQEETGAEFSKYFPPFVLLVRDFFLELKIGQQACTPDEYLENSLAYKPGHSKDIKKYNEPRQCIKEFFTRRKCFVLPKPVEDDNKIRNLEKVTEGDLRPEFLLKADEAVRSILHQAVTFRVQENPVTGHSFAELADVYVNAMNTGQVPCIESAVSLLRESECHKAKDLAIASYVQQMTEQACGLMPMEAEDLSKRHRQAMEESAKLFRKKALFDEEGKFVKELLDDINILSQEFVRQNESESSLLCKRQLDLYYSGIDEKIASSYYNKQGGYEEYKEDCTMVNAKYASLYNKGPMAQTELSNYLKQREGVGHTIMNADKALSEKARELEKLEVEREHQYLVAEAERERNEALRQEMEDEKRNHQQLVSQYMEDMDRRFAEQLENHQKAIKEKENLLAKMRQEGNERAAKLDKDLKDLRQQRERMGKDQQDMRKEMEDYQRKNNELLQEIRNLKNAEAATAEKLRQMQARAPPPPKKKKGCSIM